MKSLGETLKDARELTGRTLRSVEDATGISNSYLCMLEKDKIKKPSANVFYKLAKVYHTKIEILLYAAGIIAEAEKGTMMDVFTGPFGKLTPDEERQLTNYLKFIRSTKK